MYLGNAVNYIKFESCNLMTQIFLKIQNVCEGKVNHRNTDLEKLLSLQEVETSRISIQSAHTVIRLPDLHTDRLYPPGQTPGTHFS